jgi:uncharacterized protein YndB with AHSA1/START domain
MILRDQIIIEKPAMEVWPYIENPERMMSWNPKIKKVTLASWDGRPGVGFRYGVLYEMSGKVGEMEAEVTTYEPPFRLVIRQTGGRLSEKAYVEEIYELSEESGRTLLRQKVIMHHSGVNIFFRLLIFFITRFGRPVGKTYLTTLKELVENKPAAQDH